MTGLIADPVEASYELAAGGRLDEALALIEPLARRADADHGKLAAYANVLKGMGRLDEALAVYQRALKAAPRSGVAEHNLAALLGDMGRMAEAEAAARRAFAKGLDAPETWAALARALQGQDRFDEAEAAFREALRRRPAMADVHRDLAQVIWMRTEDADAATAELAKAVRSYPAEPALAIQLAKALQYAGRIEAGYDVLIAALGRAPPDPNLEIAASTLAGELKETVAALRHAEVAMQLAPQSATAAVALCDAQLAMGRAGPAARIAETLHQAVPNQQQVLARLATAWRLMDDPRYRRLYDYEAMVHGWTIDTPSGWTDLPAYLADLAASLRRAHTTRAHPYDQSLRQGSQTHVDLAVSQDPAIKAFFQAIDQPIRQHMDFIGQGEDPLRRRNTGRYRIEGAWSVRLRPAGFHIDHVHQQGWLSSACHIELPAAVADEGRREGWLKFGQPGVATQPPLPPEHFVRPEPGRLVLFPSYMWHGTVPFSGEEDRLTVAFDVIPA
jgi:tetratricopeptide (TPR) repeat protein